MRKGIGFAALFVVLFVTVSLCAPMLSGTDLPKKPPIMHTAFYDLEIDRYEIKGISFPFPNDKSKYKIIHVEIGETVKCICFYKIKTIALGKISESDPVYWGSGDLSYLIVGGLFFPDVPTNAEYEMLTRKMPSFTYADVQSWKAQLGDEGTKIWEKSFVYNWKAKPEHAGKNMFFNFGVDPSGKIKETDEKNNGNNGNGIVAKFIVMPKIHPMEPVPVKK